MSDRESILEALEPGKFRVKSESAVVGNFAIVFMQPNGRAEERSRREVAFNVFFCNGLVTTH